MKLSEIFWEALCILGDGSQWRDGETGPFNYFCDAARMAVSNRGIDRLDKQYGFVHATVSGIITRISGRDPYRVFGEEVHIGAFTAEQMSERFNTMFLLYTVMLHSEVPEPDIPTKISTEETKAYYQWLNSIGLR